MRLIDALEQVSLSFRSNRFKTIMSSLGITIGVIAIVVMLSVGEGLQEGVGTAFGGLNLDVITVVPGGLSYENGKFTFQKPAEFDEKDVHTIENTIGVKTVSPRTGSSVSIRFRDEERSIFINAVSAANEPELSESIDKGRFLMESDRSSIVIGSDIANNMFKMPLNPGMRVNIKNTNNEISREFTIAGVLKEKGMTSLFGGNTNMEIFTTHQALKELLDAKNYSYSQLLVIVEDQNQIIPTSKNVNESLRRLHKDEGYNIYMMNSMIEGIGAFMIMVKYALGGIGAIALVVGGIGIVNVMMLTVTERVKEIGVMKAVGATKENIRMIFILESGFLGLVSSLIGIVIGAGISILISTLGSIPIAVTWTSLALGLLFGVVMTMAAGVYPANKAARLDPVEALRAE